MRIREIRGRIREKSERRENLEVRTREESKRRKQHNMLIIQFIKSLHSK